MGAAGCARRPGCAGLQERQSKVLQMDIHPGGSDFPFPVHSAPLGSDCTFALLLTGRYYLDMLLCSSPVSVMGDPDASSAWDHICTSCADSGMPRVMSLQRHLHFCGTTFRGASWQRLGRQNYVLHLRTELWIAWSWVLDTRTYLMLLLWMLWRPQMCPACSCHHLRVQSVQRADKLVITWGWNERYHPSRHPWILGCSAAWVLAQAPCSGAGRVRHSSPNFYVCDCWHTLWLTLRDGLVHLSQYWLLPH